MNRDNINRLIQHLRGITDRRYFRMEDPRKCIGGHARQLMGVETGCVKNRLAEFLDIPLNVAEKICYPGWVRTKTGIDVYNATAEQAAKFLENFRDGDDIPTAWVKASA